MVVSVLLVEPKRCGVCLALSPSQRNKKITRPEEDPICHLQARRSRNVYIYIVYARYILSDIYLLHTVCIVICMLCKM